MINSRKIEDLTPATQVLARAFQQACVEAGLSVLIYSTLRDNAYQAKIYAQGRTTAGDIVTKARPGRSFHNYGVAFDAVPLRNGQPVWKPKTPTEHALWQTMGQCGQRVGLEWGGSWKGFRDMPHFQATQGKTIDQAQAGAVFA
jgi:peptidoglycan L-alanyl-D-glutamate endopeptidase CwlK